MIETVLYLQILTHRDDDDDKWLIAIWFQAIYSNKLD